MGKQRLADKVAIITGSGQGIGEAIAGVFADEGAKVVVATRSRENGQQTVDAITAAGGDAHLVILDVGASDQVIALVDETVSHYSRVDIMVHNAASFLFDNVENYSEENLDTVLAVNLKACFSLSKACIPHMKKSGGGRLLFTSSVTGPRVAMPGLAYYAASKSGMNGFIRTLALEVARDNITVNGVEPGFIRTAAMELLTDADGIREMEKYIPAAKLGEPNDIAWAMLFLATGEAKYITGQTIVVDGGSTLPESPSFIDELDSLKE